MFLCERNDQKLFFFFDEEMKIKLILCIASKCKKIVAFKAESRETRIETEKMWHLKKLSRSRIDLFVLVKALGGIHSRFVCSFSHLTHSANVINALLVSVYCMTSEDILFPLCRYFISSTWTCVVKKINWAELNRKFIGLQYLSKTIENFSLLH